MTEMWVDYVKVRLWPLNGRFLADLDFPLSESIDFAAYGDTPEEAVKNARRLIELLRRG